MLVAHHLSSNRLGSLQELFQHVNASLYPKDLKRRKQSVNTFRFPWNIITKQVRKKQRLYIHVNHYHNFTVKFSFDRRRSIDKSVLFSLDVSELSVLSSNVFTLWRRSSISPDCFSMVLVCFSMTSFCLYIIWSIFSILSSIWVLH